tara:strand:+ start:1328 stop:1513 length:186 start_codon:yes stop_codon:yes gene_type:complete
MTPREKFSERLKDLANDELSKAYSSHMDSGQGMAHARSEDERKLLISKLIIINNEMRKRGI